MRFVAVFAAAFCGTCWLAGRWLPFPEVENVTRKRAHLAAHGDDYDAIFIGSSRVEVQVVPAVFDARMAELGFPIRSFNAGISAMTPPEDAFFFDEITRGPHRRLRWVFVEVDYPRLNTNRQLWDGGRMTYWHDAERMHIMARCFLETWRQTPASPDHRTAGWFGRLETHLVPVTGFLEHVSGFLQRQTSLGRGAGLSAMRVKRKKQSPVVRENSVALEGWVAQAGSLEKTAREEYERTYAERLTTPQTPTYDDPAAADALRRLVKKITAIGATPVLVVSPTTRRTQFMPPEDLRDTLLLNFSDVHAFPELFATGHRLDVEHLNADGAPYYSRLLAERLMAGMREKKPRP